MFAEELSGNANRKRQEEQRARRRRLQAEKKKQQAQAAKAAASPAAASSTITSPSATPAPSIITPVATPLVVEDTTTSAATSGKSAAVANALQQRQQRQSSQLQLKSATKIQSLVRAYLSNRRVLEQNRAQHAKQLGDLAKLRTILLQKAPNNPFVAPPATATVFCRRLLFLTTEIPYQRKDASSKDGNTIQIRETQDMEKLQGVLEYTILPGLSGPDDNSNPFLPWMQSAEGRLRLKRLIRLCLHVATSPKVSLKCATTIVDMLRLVLGVHSGGKPLSPAAQKVLVPECQKWLIHPTRIEGTTMDLIETLRKFLLFTIGGSQPIPPSSVSVREGCITGSERSHAGLLFHLVLDCATAPSQQNKIQLQSRFLAEIFSVPLLSWKVSSDSHAKLLKVVEGTSSSILLVQLMESFTKMNKAPVSQGTIATALPDLDVPLTHCPATTTQCLLANLLAFGKLSPQLNGSDRSKIHYGDAATFFRFVATLLDAVPLGTFVSRDSAVAWVTDKKGTHTPIVLSPVILEQCKLLLVDSLVRNLMNCAMDSAALNTEFVLASKNDKDLKHETDLREAAEAGGAATAATLAAKDARNDRKRFWQSSKWANNLKKGVSSLLTSSAKSGADSSSNNNNSGKGVLMETSSESLRLAKGGQQSNTAKAAQVQETAKASSSSSSSKYQPDLLFALCRVYSIILARYGGSGDMDIVAGRAVEGKDLATTKPDPCTLSLLNVLCFGTDLVKASWGIIQSNKVIASDLQALSNSKQKDLSLRGLSARPSYVTSHDSDAPALLYVFLAVLSHALIITDDVEIYEMEKPLPLHQLRRCILLLKQILCRACNENKHSKDTNPFGLALISSSSKALKSLYDRSARRPLCVPKLWLVDNLLQKEIGGCTSHSDYVAILSNPVLRICPYLLSFKRRLKLFERIVTTNRIEVQGVNDINPFNNNPLKPGIPVQIMRGRVLEDGLATLNKLGRDLRQRINVQYVNEAGVRESGIDAGGLFKEFWTDLCAVAFNPHYALFKVTEDHQNCLYPNPSSGAAHGQETHITLFEFLGRILGKALFEGITVHPQFSHFFLSFLRGDYNYLHMVVDLSSIDAQLYNNLMFLKNYDGDAGDLCLTFTVADDDFGGNKQVELIPNGENVEVTNANKQRYIGLVAKHLVVDRVRDQAQAFTRGLWDVIDKTWLQLFNEPELQVLISGATGGSLDVDDMRANTRYAGGYTGIELTIGRFWSVVASLTTKQQADLLRFVTSCERPPPLGFASLNPPFTIQRVGIMRDGDRLPTASTCFNVLKLPTYSSEKVMKKRLVMAIESGAGFELA